MVSAEAVAAAVVKSLGYDLGDVVGSGSYKYTFRIERDGDVKALKLYNRSGVTARSLREIEAMRRCDHPNIAKLMGLDAVVVDGAEFTYLLEEYLEGGTLSARVGRLQREDLCSIAVSLSDALCHLTDLRLVHRDLKPDNVMFRDVTCSSPVIVDFGLVRDLGDTSLTATWLEQGPGSPFFSAPEQLNNEKGLIDWRTDQFGLGVTLAIAYYGDHPYRAHGRETNDAVLNRVASKARVPTAFTKRCSDDRLDVLSRMIQPFPVQRFTRPSMLLDAWRKAATS